MSEHKHQQEEVKQFLTGLKADLTQDIREMTNDKESYQKQSEIFTYLSGLKKNQLPNKDTLKAYKNWLDNTTALNPNDEGSRDLSRREKSEPLKTILCKTTSWISTKKTSLLYSTDGRL